MDPRILIIDDEPDMLDNYRRMLQRRGWSCNCCADSREAAKLIEKETFDLVITDLRMPGLDGIEIVRRSKAVDADIIVVVVTAHASVESAVAAVKEGAFDYLPKPFSYDQLILTIERALEGHHLQRELSRLRRRLEPDSTRGEIVGRSSAIRRVIERTDRAASSDASVLIVGESGTGKELVARRLHSQSHRSAGPFVAVDCVSLPRDLIEGELFGNEKGAYTSAEQARPGLFECADGGTLFLDEICELDTGLQAKLLRVLQERQFRRIGGRRLLTMDVRIAAATNRDPLKALAEGRLREDLLYRLDVVRITVPPLRERSTDISLLLDHFLRRYDSASRGEGLRKFSAASLSALEEYPWPGNVRELRNVVEQAVLFAPEGEIEPKHLPRRLVEEAAEDLAALPEDSVSYKSARRSWIAKFERRYFERLLDRVDGNISRAAEEAGIDRKTLYRIIREHGLS